MSATGLDQAEVLRAIGQYVKAHNIPPLDRGLRSIVAQQTANLLAGGWPLAEIKAAALELVARYERINGHKALLGLQRALEVADEDGQEHDHAQGKRTETVDPKVAAILARLRPGPSSHAFVESERFDTCALCDGPLGVHVHTVGLDSEGQGILVANGIAR